MMRKLIPAALALCSIASGAGFSTRLKDLVEIEGVRENQLLGYGMVVGLAGKGDTQQTVFPAQSLSNMLERMGIAVSPTAIRVKNTAAVMVTAALPAFAQPGMHLDTTVAAVGDAATLQGGILLMTSLRGADGEVYALAQGPVVTGGFLAGGRGASTGVNHPTVGRGPNGATVERAAPSVVPKKIVRLQLRQEDFTTASRITAAVNQHFTPTEGNLAHAESGGVVEVPVPAAFTTRITEFLSEIENLTVEADRPARVVINERTGTIVLGKDVRIAPVAILHGNLSIQIQTTVEVSQPGPLSQGKTEVVPQTAVSAKEEKARNVMLPQGATVEELVRALAAIGSTPRDVIAILQGLSRAGALEAEIEVD